MELNVRELQRDEPSEQQPRESAAHGLRAFADRAGRLANGIAIWFVILLAATFVYEVVARRLFHSPTGFANQLAAYGMPFIAFLSAARTLARNGHVIVDAFVQRLPKKVRARLEIVTDVLSLLPLVAISWVAFGVVAESWRTGYRTFSTVFTFPEYIPQVVMPLGFALLTLQQTAQVVGQLRRPDDGEKSEEV